MSVEFEASVGYGFTITEEEETNFRNKFEDFYWDYEEYFIALSSWNPSDIFVGYQVCCVSDDRAEAIPFNIFFEEDKIRKEELAAVCEKLKEFGIDKEPKFHLIQRIY